MSSGNDKKNVSIVMSYCGFPASDKAKQWNNKIYCMFRENGSQHLRR